MLCCKNGLNCMRSHLQFIPFIEPAVRFVVHAALHDHLLLFGKILTVI